MLLFTEKDYQRPLGEVNLSTRWKVCIGFLLTRNNNFSQIWFCIFNYLIKTAVSGQKQFLGLSVAINVGNIDIKQLVVVRHMLFAFCDHNHNSNECPSKDIRYNHSVFDKTSHFLKCFWQLVQPLYLLIDSSLLFVDVHSWTLITQLEIQKLCQLH